MRPLHPSENAAAGPLAGLNKGAMAAFVVRPTPLPLPDFTFVDAGGNAKSLADSSGKVVLLNIWATWCVPCREEMPMLDELQRDLGGKDFEVVAVNIDKGGSDKARDFLAETGATNLALYTDPPGKLFSTVRAVGMPTTLLIDRQGREIGRLVGPADWASTEAKRLIEAATAAPSAHPELGEIMGADAIDDILRFWFEELKPKNWFRRDTVVDAAIKVRFGEIYEELKEGVPADWLAGPEGCLAAILVLDQFPRNMFRDDARAFATDEAALALAKRAIAKGLADKLTPKQRSFLYMPFQHSEDAADQARSVGLYTALGNPLNLDFALRHQAVIARFGRFPHRNAMLGRASTEEEEAFLAKGAPF